MNLEGFLLQPEIHWAEQPLAIIAKYGGLSCLLFTCARPDCFSLLPHIIYCTIPLGLLFLAASKILQSITWAIHMTFHPFLGRQSCLQSKTSWQKEIGARTWDGIMQQSAFCTPAQYNSICHYFQNYAERFLLFTLFLCAPTHCSFDLEVPFIPPSPHPLLALFPRLHLQQLLFPLLVAVCIIILQQSTSKHLFSLISHQRHQVQQSGPCKYYRCFVKQNLVTHFWTSSLGQWWKVFCGLRFLYAVNKRTYWKGKKSLKVKGMMGMTVQYWSSSKICSWFQLSHVVLWEGAG